MNFEHNIKMSADRIGVLIGKEGRVKKELEKRFFVDIFIDSKTGEVNIKSTGNPMETDPFTVMNIISAISKGFSAIRAFRLMDDEVILNLLDLREYSGKSPNSLKRTKGRIIGIEGKSRRLIEQLSDTYISIYGHTVGVIGEVKEAKLALQAIKELAAGKSHKSVYNMLQKARRKNKKERMLLWKDDFID
jgi:ribosomal RNA assembly protein